MSQKQRRIPLRRPNLVGTIHTAKGFSAAQRSSADAFEVRVDALPAPPAPDCLAALPAAVILTVRRFDEGGLRPIPDSHRRELFLELLPAASAVDIELRSLRFLRQVAEAARRSKKTRIVSFHDFQATPPLRTLRALVARARDGGADIVKIAAKTETAGDVARLLALLDEADGPLSVMGMGRLGRASRLLFAAAGSVLNYGWLDRPLVSGQWSALQFRDLLGQI